MGKYFHPLLPILVICPLLVCSLALSKYLRKKNIELKHLAEFFASQTVVVLISFFFWRQGPMFIVLSVFSWIWALRTFGLVCGDICHTKLFRKFHIYILIFGGLVSVVLLSFNINTSIIVAPFSFCVGLIGMTFVFQAYQKGTRKNYSFLHHLNFLLVKIFFISRLTFASWILDPVLREYGILLDSYLLLVFCASLFPLYSQIVFEKHEQFLEEVLLMRNKQLFSHSAFSEFKILSAGVTHEINNALTLINAKIEQLLRGKVRGKEVDPETGLRLIMTSANRIVKSMKGLREFIYPNEVTEVMDLGDILDEVLNLYGQRLKNHMVEIKTKGLHGKIIKGHRIQIVQVFLSLINNSVDALDRMDEKWIEISCKAKNGLAEVLVIDSSLNLNEEVLTLLENPFSSTNNVMDNGIRLVLAKDILKKHGGQLEYRKESEYTTFIFKIPLNEEAYFVKNVNVLQG